MVFMIDTKLHLQLSGLKANWYEAGIKQFWGQAETGSPSEGR
jgi:hypothetical protein